MEYKVRNNLLEKERTYILEDDALVIEGEDIETEVVPYKEISSIQLKYTPNRYHRNLCRVSITTNKNKKIIITSANIKRLGGFEDKTPYYKLFLIALHKKLELYSDNIKFAVGINKGLYMFYWVLMIFIMAVIIFAGIFFFTVGLYPIVVIKLIIIIFYLPVCMRFMRKNKPVGYTAKELPDNFFLL